MKRFRIASVMALLSLTHNIVQAEVITDLPDPGSWDDITTNVSTAPTTTNQDVTPVQTEYSGSLQITSMSRKSGGTLYQMTLQKALILNRLEIKVENQRLKIHSARVLTEGGRSITVREFADSRILNTGDVLTSENLNLSEKITSVELMAESYGGSANISVRALSNYEVPKMTLKPAQNAESTTRPSNPPPPPGSTAKDQPSAPVKPATPAAQTPNAQDTRPAPIMRGTVILYSGSYVGEIVDVLNSNMVRVRLEGYSGTHDLDRRLIATKTNCLDGFCSGYNILYSGSYSGMIRTIFSNRKAQVVLDGYSGLHLVDLSQLSRSMNCLNNFCVGEHVRYSNTYEAHIKAIYSSGVARVVLEGYSGVHAVQISQLSKMLNCSGGFCVGENVMYSNTYKGRVIKIYSNGQALVTLDGYSGYHTVAISQLSRPITCAQGICVGNRIVYARNYSGHVVAVYSNGTAQVSLSGYSGTHNVNLRDLVKTR
ncbi:beta-sandwich domain-containing protein [Bdellovibrio bacteriovorus]|uniref:beta-sandwich domain-containing protein n=1 Tax=Bdellovibrio bacteriovorus TaxID=959 RepID=UPI0021CE364D|nr:beta-sandwich domain-containing protein [Bdellovibrio bacteriovorus]UXR65822.1 beta-sandwich domain-containing protein [Bdellovibrio bacteriovorus]